MTVTCQTVMQTLYQRDIWEGFQPGGFTDLQGWNGDHPALDRLIYESAEDQGLAPSAGTAGLIAIDVGVWKGQSTITLANAMKKRGIDGCVIAVDIFLGSAEHFIPGCELFSRNNGMPDLFHRFMNNIHAQGLSEYVVPLPQMPQVAADILSKIGLQASVIHIDASHEYEDVLRDAELYWNLIRPGGYLIGDDYVGWPGVIKGADEFAISVGLPLTIDTPKWILHKNTVDYPNKFLRHKNPGAPIVFPHSEAEMRLAAESRSENEIFVHFPTKLGQRPTIHVRPEQLDEARSRDGGRVRHCIKYVDDIISNYLLNDEFYFTHFSENNNYSDNMVCCFQIGDRATANIPSLGLTGNNTVPKVKIVPDLYFWSTRGCLQERFEIANVWTSWNDRLPVAFWRGATTGLPDEFGPSFLDRPRIRLCLAAKKLGGRLDAKLNSVVQISDEQNAIAMKLHLNEIGLFSSPIPHTEYLKTLVSHRYLIDIEGNASSTAFLLRFLTGACVLKVASVWKDWCENIFLPWEHYVPVRLDLTDLEDKIAWCLEHDEEARQIAESGRKAAQKLTFGYGMLRAAECLLAASRPNGEV